MPPLASGTASAAAAFSRPDPETIRSVTREILADPRFAPRKTWAQWLAEKLGNWDGPDLGLPEGIAEVVVWILLIWCVLTLLAILGHFIWTIAVLIGLPGGRRSVPPARTMQAQRLTPDQTLARMQALAQAGQFREALGLMMAALLEALGSAGILKLHESKTNGEYVREYPDGRPGREDFRQFIRSGDAAVYGGSPCGAATYHELHGLFERIQQHVQRRP